MGVAFQQGAEQVEMPLIRGATVPSCLTERPSSLFESVERLGAILDERWKLMWPLVEGVGLWPG